MEDKGKSLVGGDEKNLTSELEGGPSNMEEHGSDGSDDNYDGEDKNSDEGGLLDDDEGDESKEGDESEAGSEIPTTFECLEYEALAEKKRKALADSQRDGSEKRAKYDAINISNSTSGMEGFMDFFSTGLRRKSRKHKKRGRRQGSKKEVSPDILKRFKEALFLHANKQDAEALLILLEVIKQAPACDTAYYYLSLVSEKLGMTEPSSTEALKIAANIKDCLNILPREAVSKHPELITKFTYNFCFIPWVTSFVVFLVEWLFVCESCSLLYVIGKKRTGHCFLL